MIDRAKETRFRTGSGNVFADLRVAQPEQEMVKAELVKAICLLLSGRGLRQIDAVSLLGISQPRISLLMRGRTDGFSTEMLMRLLNRLGQRIDIVVKPSPRGRLVGDTHVDWRSVMILEHPSPAYGGGPAPSRVRAARRVSVPEKGARETQVRKKK
jgi:predicted XRE-type DNA-binding protein